MTATIQSDMVNISLWAKSWPMVIHACLLSAQSWSQLEGFSCRSSCLCFSLTHVFFLCVSVSTCFVSVSHTDSPHSCPLTLSLTLITPSCLHSGNQDPPFIFLPVSFTLSGYLLTPVCWSPVFTILVFTTGFLRCFPALIFSSLSRLLVVLCGVFVVTLILVNPINAWFPVLVFPLF